MVSLLNVGCFLAGGILYDSGGCSLSELSSGSEPLSLRSEPPSLFVLPISVFCSAWMEVAALMVFPVTRGVGWGDTGPDGTFFLTASSALFLLSLNALRKSCAD